ncbi:MAG: RDD family protein [Pseudomonadota bacterium]
MQDMSLQSWHIPDPDRQPEFYADVATKRLLAWIIDTLVILAISALILALLFLVSFFIWPIVIFTVGLIYRCVTLARNSATWGMRVMAIEFRTLHGQRFGPLMAFLHSMGFTISFAFPVLQIISITLMLTSKRGQGLSDLALGTVAMNRRAQA